MFCSYLRGNTQLPLLELLHGVYVWVKAGWGCWAGHIESCKSREYGEHSHGIVMGQSHGTAMMGEGVRREKKEVEERLEGWRKGRVKTQILTCAG